MIRRLLRAQALPFYISASHAPIYPGILLLSLSRTLLVQVGRGQLYLGIVAEHPCCLPHIMLQLRTCDKAKPCIQTAVDHIADADKISKHERLSLDGLPRLESLLNGHRCLFKHHWAVRAGNWVLVRLACTYRARFMQSSYHTIPCYALFFIMHLLKPNQIGKSLVATSFDCRSIYLS